MRCRTIVAGAVCCAGAATGALAQSRFVIRAPEQSWKTVVTEHWVVHYPAGATLFANCLVPRLEPIYRATSALVGYSTTQRVTLVIEDAMSFDGAFASANARAPVIVLQTQPSSPRSGGYSDCATARMTHELTHILQLSRPWTSDHAWWTRAFMRLLPAEPGPIVLRRQAWLRESYAEHIEGRLTATGAPYTTARANTVRLLALRDQLPPYSALSDSYDGQYLVGAAFVDWLAARSGEEALRALWPLMSSPAWPGDSAAYRPLFGGPPDSLYAVFTADAKARAQRTLSRVETAGIVRGDAVRPIGYADAVTVSPDGGRVAAVMGSPLVQLTIWSTSDSSMMPLLRLPLPTGQSPNAPRFTRDGARVLVVHWELVGSGVWRPDLYEWTLSTRRLRRITHGAAIRDADPLPNGREAVATRCEFGICDVVVVDLATGMLRTLVRGAADRAYYRPRSSSDGATIVVAEQSGARCRIVLVDARTGERRYADPDDGLWRYEPAFLRDGRLVVVSEASGIPNLEIIDAGSHATTALTRLAAPAYAPEPDPTGDAVYFIREAPGGSELRRVTLSDSARTTIALRDTSLAPAVPVSLPQPPPRMFAPESIPPARAYGLGPRFTSVLPAFDVGPGGASASALAWSSDIVGRLSVMLNGTFGSGDAWRGASASAVVRSLSLPFFVNATRVVAPRLDYLGASARAEIERGTWSARQRATIGLALGDAGIDTGSRAPRALAFGSFALARTQVRNHSFGESLALSVGAGRTADVTWARSVVSGTLEVASMNSGSLASLSASYGVVTDDAPNVERFSLGGRRSPLVDMFVFDQVVAQPLLETIATRATHVATVRVTGPRIGPVAPFAWWGALGSAHRTVVGIGRSFTDDPRRNWRIPGAQLSGAVGYAFGETRGVRAHLSLGFRQ